MEDTAFNVKVTKLSGPDDWAKWKWTMQHVLKAHQLEEIVSGAEGKPAVTAEESSREARTKWNTRDARAVSLIATALGDSIARLVLTCDTAHEIWNLLCARFERSSKQRLDSIVEQFYRVQKDETEDMITHIANLQKLFMDMNVELRNHKLNELSEIMLTLRIMSTLGKEYNSFRDVWDSLPADKQTLSLLIERLCNIEKREAAGGESAFLAGGKKQKSKHEDSVKKKKDNVKDKKKRFPCRKCQELGHWAAECPSRKDEQQKTAFMAKALGAADCRLETSYWVCDSGASYHMTPRREYFRTFEVFDRPREIRLGKRGQSMVATGVGNIDIETFCDGEWKKAELLGVWFVPEAGANLFSVKAVSKRGLYVVMEEKKVSVRAVDGDFLKAEGSADGGLYIMSFRVDQSESEAAAHLSNRADTLQVYHERLGHQNYRYVKDFLRRLGLQVSEKDMGSCSGCAVGKMHRVPFHSRPPQSVATGELVHADVCGPMSVASVGKANYFVCFKDDFSKFRRIFFIAKKSEVARCLETFLNEAKTMGHTVKAIRTDGGGEFVGSEVTRILDKRGVQRILCPPYTPESNGSIERENRTIVESARSMMCSTSLPMSLWAESCNTAVYLLNLSGRSSVEGKSPSEHWFGRKVLDVSHLRIFGTECVVHIEDRSRRKFDAKGREGFVIGYVNGYDGYRVWIPELKKVVCSHHVRFLPERVCSQQEGSTAVKIPTIESGCQTEGELRKNNEGEDPARTEMQSRNVHEKDSETVDEEPNTVNEENSETDGEYESSEEQHPEVAAPRRGSRERKTPNHLKDFVLLASCPENYKQAMDSEDKEKWIAAMREELRAIADNETWDLTDRPPDVKVLRNRWVLRAKETRQGELFKARLVACGQFQRAGIDFDEAFSPVARYSTVRLLLSIAASGKMRLRQFDVRTAYLYGSLPEPIYMFQPEGFQDGTDRVCRVKKGLYGLRQSGRCWNARFVQFMTGLGFRKSSADPCLFFKHGVDDTTYVTLYVDDGLVISKRENTCEDFLRLLRKEFKITEGEVNSYLGIQIERRSPEYITISQPRYVERVLEKFSMSECNPISTPAGKEESSADEPVVDKLSYRAAVGSLLYLSTATRPDLAFAVGKAARVMENPTKADRNNVLRIFRYLRGTPDYGITYGTNQELQVFSDSDFAGCKKTGRSTTGIVAMYGGGAVSWKSQLQRTIALSTTEAEIMAASEAAKELIWLNTIIQETLRIVRKPTLYIDNASAIKLAKNPEFHARSKHINVRFLFVREKFSENVLCIEHIEGKNQPADICTKALEKTRFEMLRLKLGVQ